MSVPEDSADSDRQFCCSWIGIACRRETGQGKGRIGKTTSQTDFLAPRYRERYRPKFHYYTRLRATYRRSDNWFQLCFDVAMLHMARFGHRIYPPRCVVAALRRKDRWFARKQTPADFIVPNEAAFAKHWSAGTADAAVPTLRDARSTPSAKFCPTCCRWRFLAATLFGWGRYGKASATGNLGEFLGSTL